MPPYYHRYHERLPSQPFDPSIYFSDWLNDSIIRSYLLHFSETQWPAVAKYTILLGLHYLESKGVDILSVCNVDFLKCFINLRDLSSFFRFQLDEDGPQNSHQSPLNFELSSNRNRDQRISIRRRSSPKQLRPSRTAPRSTLHRKCSRHEGKKCKKKQHIIQLLDPGIPLSHIYLIIRRFLLHFAESDWPRVLRICLITGLQYLSFSGYYLHLIELDFLKKLVREMRRETNQFHDISRGQNQKVSTGVDVKTRYKLKPMSTALCRKPPRLLVAQKSFPLQWLNGSSWIPVQKRIKEQEQEDDRKTTAETSDVDSDHRSGSSTDLPIYPMWYGDDEPSAPAILRKRKESSLECQWDKRKISDLSEVKQKEDSPESGNLEEKVPGRWIVQKKLREKNSEKLLNGSSQIDQKETKESHEAVSSPSTKQEQKDSKDQQKKKVHSEIFRHALRLLPFQRFLTSEQDPQQLLGGRRRKRKLRKVVQEGIEPDRANRNGINMEANKIEKESFKREKKSRPSSMKLGRTSPMKKIMTTMPCHRPRYQQREGAIRTIVEKPRLDKRRKQSYRDRKDISPRYKKVRVNVVNIEAERPSSENDSNLHEKNDESSAAVWDNECTTRKQYRKADVVELLPSPPEPHKLPIEEHPSVSGVGASQESNVQSTPRFGGSSPDHKKPILLDVVRTQRVAIIGKSGVENFSKSESDPADDDPQNSKSESTHSLDSAASFPPVGAESGEEGFDLLSHYRSPSFQSTFNNCRFTWGVTVNSSHGEDDDYYHQPMFQQKTAPVPTQLGNFISFRTDDKGLRRGTNRKQQNNLANKRSVVKAESKLKKARGERETKLEDNLNKTRHEKTTDELNDVEAYWRCRRAEIENIGRDSVMLSRKANDKLEIDEPRDGTSTETFSDSEATTISLFHFEEPIAGRRVMQELVPEEERDWIESLRAPVDKQDARREEKSKVGWGTGIDNLFPLYKKIALFRGSQREEERSVELEHPSVKRLNCKGYMVASVPVIRKGDVIPSHTKDVEEVLDAMRPKNRRIREIQSRNTLDVEVPRSRTRIIETGIRTRSQELPEKVDQSVETLFTDWDTFKGRTLDHITPLGTSLKLDKVIPKDIVKLREQLEMKTFTRYERPPDRIYQGKLKIYSSSSNTHSDVNCMVEGFLKHAGMDNFPHVLQQEKERGKMMKKTYTPKTSMSLEQMVEEELRSNRNPNK